MNKDFATIKEFAPSDVKVLDAFMTCATQKDVDFLNTFKADKLLYNFRVTAGISDKKAESSYSGWENTRIGGHTLGHYLAAAAQAVARGFGDAKGSDSITLGERLSYLVDSLAECQNELGTGFIFGATMADATKPELQFDLIEAGTTADTWVPWYTAHKLMNGLVETWKSARIKTALTVAERFGEWIYKRTNRWSPETKTKVLSVEYGGMNDCLYELYKCAKADGYADSEHFLRAAEAFDEVTLFEAVREWNDACGGGAGVSREDSASDANSGSEASGLPDVLNNRHANTTIPKFVGAMNRFCTLGDAKYLDYAKSFWDIVVNHHTYITGGNSECEHFGLADVLDAERSNSNCETCNTHNMLKLTRMLFMATGDKKYADYYENTFINAILASVNAETGMTLYFQPMATGLFKTYCNPDVNKNYFWCCTGTGLENFTKLGDSFYFHTDDTLIVNEYASSAVHWAEKGLSLVQETDLPMTEKMTFRIVADSTANLRDGAPIATDAVCSNDFALALRIPDWLAEPARVSLNGADATCRAENGYLVISREWKDGDTVELSLPAKIVPYTLPDNTNVFAFKYGPVVLAAELGTEKKYLYQIGIMCDVAGNKYIRGQEMTLTGNYGSTSGLKTLPAETIRVKGGSVADFMRDINEHLRRVPGTFRFILHDTNLDDEKEPLVFVPYYQITEQRYGIYWLFTEAAGNSDPASSGTSGNAARTGTDATPNTSERAGGTSIGDPLSDSTLIQSIGVGYGTQTEGGKELFPFMQETGTGSVGNPDELTRFANAGGSFSYMMKVAPNKRNFLVCTLLKADDGKTLRITADGKTIASFTLDSRREGTPRESINSREQITPGDQSTPRENSNEGDQSKLRIQSSEKYTQIFEIPQEIIASTTPDELATIHISFSGAPKDSSQHENTPQSARIAAPLEIRCIS